jgi:energy-coupling factor transporter ATP-binding protein EcfA2
MSSGIFLHDVTFRYAGAREHSLSHLTLHIEKGTFLGVTGSNGSGKTTLTYLFNGLIPHEIDGKLEGEVTIDSEQTREKSVSYFAKKVGMVFQNPDHMIFNLSVYEEIEFGLRNLGFKENEKRIKHALSEVGLADKIYSDPQNLSFGQKQKLCIASALAMDTEYIVLDEPSSMLDYKSSLDLYDLLAKLHKKGKTVIVIEHDTDIIYTFADHSLVLQNGSVVKFGQTQHVFEDSEYIKMMGIKVPRKIQ